MGWKDEQIDKIQASGVSNSLQYKHIKEVSEAEDKPITLVINEILRFALNKYLEPVESV